MKDKPHGITPEVLIRVQKEFGLTPQQLKIAAGKAIHGNGSRAAREAGSKAKHPDMCASETLAVPKVKRAVQSLLRENMAQVAEKFNLSREKVLEDLEYIKRQAVDGDKPSHMAAVRATELQGRAIGIGFERKVLHRHELIDTRQLIAELDGQISTGDAEHLGQLLDKSRAEDADLL